MGSQCVHSLASMCIKLLCMCACACKCLHVPHIFHPNISVGLCSRWGCMHVTWKNTPPLRSCASVHACALCKARPPVGPISSSLSRSSQCYLFASLGICQLRAGVPLLGNSTPPSPHSCLIRRLQVPTHKRQPMIAMDEFLNCPWCLRVQCKHNGSY